MKKGRVLILLFALMVAAGLILGEHLDLLYYARRFCFACTGLE